MRKYLYILKTEFINNIQYVFNFLVGLITYAVIIYIYFNLWNFLYEDFSNVINGYTCNQMIWYILFTELIWAAIKGRKICQNIADDVKSGNITYQLNKPYSYVNYIFFKVFGDFLFKYLLYVPISFLIGFILVGGIPNFSIFSFLLALLFGIIGAVINIFIIIAIGLLSFFIEDANPVYWIYSKIILMMGTLFPIEFFPKVMQPILYYSPIYAMNYGPAKLFIDFSYDSLGKIALSSLIYLIISYVLCNLIYKKGVKRLNVNGG